MISKLPETVFVAQTKVTRNDLREKIIERELKKPGYKAKIRAFCCHCIFDPYQEGTWLNQVKNCTSFDCPLYQVRPQPCRSKEE